MPPSLTSTIRQWASLAALLGLCLTAGCATTGPALTPPATTAPLEVSDRYQINCPDTLEVTVGDQPRGTLKVRADGRVNLGQGEELRVEGQTVGQAERAVARALGVPRDQAHIRISQFNSQQIYVFGEINGLQRAVPYKGQETVVDLLRRVGGLADGAEPEDVTVVRGHVASGGRPEVFPVPLHDILAGKDTRSNLTLQPFDQVYVGETRRSCWLKCLPPCLRPFCKNRETASQALPKQN